jgi:hypothetical protein
MRDLLLHAVFENPEVLPVQTDHSAIQGVAYADGNFDQRGVYPDIGCVAVGSLRSRWKAKGRENERKKG